ncbi:disease resistance protein RPV1-like isoform X2 [Lotus japonicus]|uniref:disease resistance protein RPV1-like isoform X2 n=1 Tax=Lotus japonicus TaxID=34305 RepID=UPI00258E5753|nr:disease resistance protein RPV1-like isoform X2 [Lotus japonicus]
MALLPSSSSSTRGRGFNYGVFLSCGTEDTLEFTGLLYQALCNKGIRTFTDCEVVDEITPALEEAIQTSRIAIVGLSKNYASSSFCLDKLSKILDHFNSKVHPVFYQVDPDDVQMLRGTYGEAIAMHKKRFNDRIQKWTMALQQVSNLPGWQFGLGNEYDHQDFIRKIVKEVFNKIVYIPIVTREDEDGIKVTCLSEGISEISYRFDGKNKVMFIVDDVDKLEQLQQVKADKHLLGLSALTDKEAVKTFFDKKIHNMVKKRFYSLKMAEKRVFLDIVCYGEGYHLVDVQHILRAHYGCCVTDYIRVLVDKSLIHISPRGEKTLHHWAECMGTELVQLESPKEPGKRSRLWIPEDIYHVLEDGTGTDKIEIICLDLSSTKEKKNRLEWRWLQEHGKPQDTYN